MSGAPGSASLALGAPIVERQAVLTAFSVWLAAMFAFCAWLPDPYWAAISAWILAQPDHRAALTKAVLRLAGTAAGCFVGFWLAVWTAGEPAEQIVFLSVLVGVSTARRFASAYGYAWIMFGVTATMIVVGNASGGDDLFRLATARAMEISAGVLAHLISTLLFGRLIGTPPPAPVPTGAAERLEIEHTAILAGVATAMILILWTFTDLPSVAQAIVSVAALMDREVGRMEARGLHRIVGCILGGVLGIAGALLLPQSLVAWSIAFGAGIWWLARLHHSTDRFTYVGTQGGIAFILGMITGPGAPTTITPAVERLAGMMTGVVVLIVLAVMLKPLFLGRAARRLAAQ